MGSTRLRGKSLIPIAGIPLLKRVVDLASHIPFVTEVCVATSELTEDDPIQAYCEFLNVKCIRGSQLNVFGRFLKAAQDLNVEDQIIRLTADNPFNRIEISKALFEEHVNGGFDYSCIEGLSHVVCEIIQAGSFFKISEKDFKLSPYDLEHVTPFFRSINSPFNIQIRESSFGGLQPQLEKLLTIDREEDRVRIEKLIQELSLEGSASENFEKIYDWLKANNKTT